MNVVRYNLLCNHYLISGRYRRNMNVIVQIVNMREYILRNDNLLPALLHIVQHVRVLAKERVVLFVNVIKENRQESNLVKN